MNNKTLATFLFLITIVVVWVSFYTIEKKHSKAFNDAKMETRYIAAMEETDCGIVELRLATKTVLNSNKVAENLLGYGAQEMQGLLLKNILPKTIAEIDFEKDPPIRVYRCFITNKNGTYSEVFVRTITAKKIDRIFFTINLVGTTSYSTEINN